MSSAEAAVCFGTGVGVSWTWVGAGVTITGAAASVGADSTAAPPEQLTNQRPDNKRTKCLDMLFSLPNRIKIAICSNLRDLVYYCSPGRIERSHETLNLLKEGKIYRLKTRRGRKWAKSS
jgi:hypothetical protein